MTEQGLGQRIPVEDINDEIRNLDARIARLDGSIRHLQEQTDAARKQRDCLIAFRDKHAVAP